jgi:hypothetical protein
MTYINTCRKSICVTVLLAFCGAAESQEYIDIQLPGKNISLQYPAGFVLKDSGDESALGWEANDDSTLEFGFGQIEDVELRDIFNDFKELSEVAEAEGFGYLIEPRKVKIGSFNATELKVVVPAYALKESGEEVLKTLMHMFVMEIDGASYICNMHGLLAGHEERHDEIFQRLCSSVRVQQL